jgi:hypothetical protein
VGAAVFGGCTYPVHIGVRPDAEAGQDMGLGIGVKIHGVVEALLSTERRCSAGRADLSV